MQLLLQLLPLLSTATCAAEGIVQQQQPLLGRRLRCATLPVPTRRNQQLTGGAAFRRGCHRGSSGTASSPSLVVVTVV